MQIDNYVDIVKIQVKQIVHKWAFYCYTSEFKQCMYLNGRVCTVCCGFVAESRLSCLLRKRRSKVPTNQSVMWRVPTGHWLLLDSLFSLVVSRSLVITQYIIGRLRACWLDDSQLICDWCNLCNEVWPTFSRLFSTAIYCDWLFRFLFSNWVMGLLRVVLFHGLYCF